MLTCNYHHVNIVTFDPFQPLSLYIAILSQAVLVIHESKEPIREAVGRSFDSRRKYKSSLLHQSTPI